MAFEIASLVTSLVARDGPILGTLSRVRSALGSTFSAMRKVSGAAITPPDAQHGVNVFASLSAGVGGLHAGLIGLTGLNLGTALGLGTLSGVSSGVVGILKNYMDLNDQTIQVRAQFGAMGLDADKMTERWKNFATQMSATGQMSKQAARDLAMMAIQRGPDASKFEQTADAASKIAAATGLPVQNVLRMVNLGEENYRSYTRLLRLAGQQVEAGASQEKVMERVNALIARGAVAQTEMQQSFRYRIQAMQNSFSALRSSIGQAIGPAFGAMLGDMMARIKDVVDRMTEWVNSHQEVVAAIGRLIGQVVMFGGAMIAGVAAVRVMTGVLSQLRVVSIALAVAKGILRVATDLLAGAFRGLLAATGIGLILVLVGALLQASGVMDTLGDNTKGFAEKLDDLFGPIRDFFLPIWKKIKVEAQVMFDAVKAGWNSLVEVMVDLGNIISETAASVVTWWDNAFGDLFGSVDSILDGIKGLWKNFLAELSIIGIRIRQFVLLIIIGFKSIPAVVQWLGANILIFLHFFITNFPSVMWNGIKLVWEGFKLLGQGVMAVFKGIWNVIKGGKFSEAFEGIQEQWDKLKAQARATFKEFKPIDLSVYTTGVASAEKKRLAELQAEADRKKAESLERQEGLRRDLTEKMNAEEHGKKMEQAKQQAAAGTPPHLKGGQQQRHGLGDLVGVWKKMQEQAAGGQFNPVVDVARKQLTEQKQTNTQLAKLNDKLAGAGVKGGPVPVIPQ